MLPKVLPSNPILGTENGFLFDSVQEDSIHQGVVGFGLPSVDRASAPCPLNFFAKGRTKASLSSVEWLKIKKRPHRGASVVAAPAGGGRLTP